MTNGQHPFNSHLELQSIQNRLRRLNVKNLERFNEELLSLYLQNTEERLSLLKKYLTDRQIQQALKTAHELKSTSLNLSADYFGTQFNSMEALMSAGLYPKALETLNQVETHFNQLKQEIMRDKK